MNTLTNSVVRELINHNQAEFCLNGQGGFENVLSTEISPMNIYYICLKVEDRIVPLPLAVGARFWVEGKSFTVRDLGEDKYFWQRYVLEKV